MAIKVRMVEKFLRWYDEFNEFLDAKQLRTVYPTVDDCVQLWEQCLMNSGT